MKKINIAIDGPSGVGKSTIAKNISKQLELVFINTGLMYRAIAYYCLNNDIALDDEDAIVSKLSTIDINLLPNEVIELNHINITDKLWNDDISVAASQVAKLKRVRQFCVSKQKEISKNKPGVVMEGRDIGTVVMPDAEVKVFLTASSKIRALRRIKQLRDSGKEVDEEQVLQNIIDRDRRDIERDTDPLVKAPDSVEIDTSDLTIDEVIDKIIKLAKMKMD